MYNWDSYTDTARKVAERVPFPHPRRRSRNSATDPAKPALVPGRGIASRRHRSPVFRVLLWLLGLLVLAGLVSAA